MAVRGGGSTKLHGTLYERDEDDPVSQAGDYDAFIVYNQLHSYVAECIKGEANNIARVVSLFK